MIRERPPSRFDALLGMLIMNAFFIGFCLVIWWTYQSHAAYLLDTAEAQEALLVFEHQKTALPFVWVSIPSILLIANIQVGFVRLLKRKVPPTLVKVQKAATWVMFLGVALAVFGNQLVNPLWKKTFTEAGYSRCNTSIIIGSKAIFNQAWVLDPADCHDPVLKDILNDSWGGLRIEEGRRYLEEKHRFLESYNASQSVP